jgi:inner membrane protein involved in colicin E2 resistance
VIHDCMIVGPTQRRLNYLYLVVDIDSYVVARVGRATMFIISCYSGAYIFIVVESTRVHVIRYDIVGK